MVADAEAIKTLLKLPYLSEPISMIVHRVGNTVLIDDFDLERLFCRYRVCWYHLCTKSSKKLANYTGF